MTRVLHISKFYYPYFGGIEDVAHSIVMEMRDNYEQRVICFNHEQGGTIRTIVDGVDVVRVGALCTISSQPLSVSYYYHLRNEINSFKPDVIHVHFPNPLIGIYLLMLRIDKIKLIIHWHSDILGKDALYWAYRRLERKILERADTIITTSPHYIEKSVPLQRFASKVRVLPNVVNEEKMQLLPENEKEIKRIKERFKGKKIVLFVGRHVPYKGIDFLIDSIPYLSDKCIVLIGGTGEQTVHLQHLAAPMGEKVQFIGRLQDKEIRCYMHAADVFAFPSIDRREAFGVALAEALYCGLPAVSFRIEGSGSMWVNQNLKTGIVVDTIDARKYAEAINTLVENDELRLQYGKEASRWIRAHFLKDQIHSLSGIYG